MDELYRSYLGFLTSMSRGLESRTALNEKKLAAAQQDDLMTLNELLNQEQAQALNFRGLELTRDKLLPQLGLVNVPLLKVPDRFPPAMQAEARQVVAALQEQFRAYRTEADAARSTLEGHLHEAEKILEEAGATPPSGPGYTPPETEPPPNMKTDFRA